MRDCWYLPKDEDLQIPSRLWFRSVVVNLPSQSIDNNLVVAWRSWHARNEKTHDKPLLSVEGSKRFLCSYASLLGNIQSLSTDQILKGKQIAVAPNPRDAHVQKKKDPPDKSWVRPPEGWIKLSIDGSYKADDGTAGTRIILQNDTGKIILSACRSLHACEEPLDAEVSACVEGLELALLHSHLPIIMETDCSQLVSAILAKSKDRSLYMHLISEIKSLASGDRLCKFVKVDRGQVRVSHCLVKWARSDHRTAVWLGSGSDVVIQALEVESSVIPNA
jgi:ribonuclease HI